MYKSPVEIYATDPIVRDVAREKDKWVIESVQSLGIDVDRNELIKALSFDRNQYLKGYQEAIQRLSPKWFSVDERLPDERGNYLVVINYEKPEVHEAVFSMNRNLPVWLDPVEEFEKYKFVTHWMPLPEPPKDGE